MTSLLRWLLLPLLLGSPAAAGLRLLVIEQPGCTWCARWNAEIAPQYPLTEEGRAAPLLRAQLHAPPVPGRELVRPATLTPTFVMLRDGREAARLEGYPGADFFWPLLQQLLHEAQRESDE